MVATVEIVFMVSGHFAEEQDWRDDVASLPCSTSNVIQARPIQARSASECVPSRGAAKIELKIGKAHGEVFAEIRPAATMVEVRGLVNPDHLVEIEADAIVAGSVDS